MTHSAADVRWMDQARCNGAGFDFTPASESPGGLAQARRGWCNACPVRTECLKYALLYRESGYWGGTMTQDRTLLSYSRNRVKCPVCGSKALVTVEADGAGFQICQSCAVSWTRSSPPERNDHGNDPDRGTPAPGAGTDARSGRAAGSSGGKHVPA